MTQATSHLTPELRLRQRREATADLARAESAMREVLREMRELHGAERARYRRYVGGAIIATRIALGRFRIAWAQTGTRSLADAGLAPSTAEMADAAVSEAVIRRAA